MSASTDIAARAAARGWSVPAGEVQVFGPKMHRYAVVIPVINEGERIRRQLRALAALRPPVDVVVVDGGSTDGSVAPDFLAANDVRALLVKTGPGRLSAQLRLGYAWCLLEGYHGIVTIDGNGKDGLGAVAEFCRKLDEGYDYIQGSRYLPGGAAENTPLDRRIANRLIHVPIVSLAGGFHYTDTTNGYRAYSARLLLDPRVAPFRDVFDRYEILVYMSARAPRLGYRVIEIPVERRYPADAPPPTKISGWQGRAGILRDLWGVLTHRFDPRA